MVAVLFIVFLVALAIGVPVAFSLGLASVAYMLGAHIQMINFAQYFFKGLDSFTLLCIPGFTFAGNLMNQGGISDKLLDFADALVGHITGGLAYANVLASMVFAGISGTALSDTVALGGVEIPMMVNQGYDVPFSVAITAASSCLGPIIPPSVPMIMAATMTGLSVSKMFMAGIVPGLLLGFGMCATCYILSVKRHYPKRNTPPKWSHIWHATKEHHPVRHHGRHRHPHRGFHHLRGLRPVRGSVHLPQDGPQGDVLLPEGYRFLRFRYHGSGGLCKRVRFHPDQGAHPQHDR